MCSAAGYVRVGLIIGDLVRATLHSFKVNQSIAAHARMALTPSSGTAVAVPKGVPMDIARVLAPVVSTLATWIELAPYAYSSE